MLSPVVQIVGYEPRAGNDLATLLLAEDGVVTRETLGTGTQLSHGLGSRHCAGSVDGTDHTPCNREAAPYCDRHTSRWPCARCTGDCAMPIENCYEEHAIYLAAFAPDTFKVGVTKRWRLETRLQEQGADMAAHIRTVENGRKARAIEAELAEDLTDRVRVPDKVAGLPSRVDADAWEGVLGRFEVIDRFDFEYGLELDRQPVAETLGTGTVVGTKGRLLVLSAGGTTYATDLRDLVGYEVSESAPEVKRQSSLGAYQ